MNINEILSFDMFKDEEMGILEDEEQKKKYQNVIRIVDEEIPTVLKFGEIEQEIDNLEKIYKEHIEKYKNIENDDNIEDKWDSVVLKSVKIKLLDYEYMLESFEVEVNKYEEFLTDVERKLIALLSNISPEFEKIIAKNLYIRNKNESAEIELYPFLKLREYKGRIKYIKARINILKKAIENLRKNL